MTVRSRCRVCVRMVLCLVVGGGITSCGTLIHLEQQYAQAATAPVSSMLLLLLFLSSGSLFCPAATASASAPADIRIQYKKCKDR